MIELHPLDAIGEVKPGDDLAGLLSDAVASAGLAPAGGDVIVVTQKIVSKAENRFVDLREVHPGEAALKLAAELGRDARLLELILSESSRIVRATPQVIITRHRSGHVMANAGIDQSNLGSDDTERVLLLPEDTDASAAALRERFASIWPEAPAVVISDSFGRPWRLGVVNVAIGAAGLPALLDRRGEVDRDGRPLRVTQTALGDLLASAAGLVAGEGAEGVPAVLVRGARTYAQSLPASALVRPLEEDLFR